MKKVLYWLFLLLAAYPLRAEVTTDWTPTLPPDPGATFTLVLEDEPYGMAELIGGGIYKENEQVTIKCVPQDGYRFVRWTVNGQLFASTAQYSFTMPEDNLILIAELEALTKHHLTLEVEPANAAQLHGKGDYYPGTSISIECNMDDDYTFSHWTKNGEKYSEQKDLAFTMEDADVALVAICQYTPNALISISTNDDASGVVSMTGGRYAVGEEIEFVATAKTNFRFSHWEANGTFFSDQAAIKYIVENEDIHFVAVFDFMPVQPDDPSMDLTSVVYIEASPIGAASFNIQSGTRHHEGDTLLLQAQMRSNYELEGWYVNDVCVATTPIFMYIVGYSDATIVLRAKQIVYRKLTLQANPQNAVQFNISSPATIQEGSQVALQANVLPDYTFKGWYEGTTLLSTDKVFSYTMPNKDITLVAMAEVSNPDEWIPSLPFDPDMESVYVEVTSANNTMGKTSGSAYYTIGSKITIEAIPYYGYHFVQWNDGNTNAVRTVEVTEETTYTAQFASNQYTIQVAANDDNMGTTSGSGTYAYRTTTTIKATPKQGYVFEKWSDNNNSTTRSILVTSDSVFTAHFAPITLKLNVLSSNTTAGMVTGDGAYPSGESVVISATAHEGYNFVRWSDGNTEATRTIVVNKDNDTYIAYFVAKQYELTLDCNDHAMGYVIGAGSYPYASNVTIHAKAYKGYEFAQWSDGNTESSRNINLTENTTLTALFKSPNVVATICYGEEYLWHNLFYNASGVHVVNVNGVADTLFLTVLPEVLPTIEVANICNGETYTWRGNTYTESGEYSVALKNQAGCDSLIVLQLTVNQAATSSVTATTCDSYDWNGETYTESGEYTFNTTAANGCDSIVTLHLTINNTQYAEVTVTACDSYDWNGETYTESGEYTYNTTAANGCDSIVTLHLTINNTQYAEVSATACDSYDWNGETYTESGEYTYNTTAANGCDSIVTLHLTINKTQYVEETVTACDSYDWNGETYTESGEYTYTTTAANGCDSIVTLHLTIVSPAIIAEESVIVCESDLPYSWYDHTCTEVGKYIHTEQYVGTEIDSVIHVLILDTYKMTLPSTVTPPSIGYGSPINVSIANEEIQEHINHETWYAPNSFISWYIYLDGMWQELTYDPMYFNAKELLLKYVVESDCGSVESSPIKVSIIATQDEHLPDQPQVKKVVINDQVFIIRGDKTYSLMGMEIE